MLPRIYAIVNIKSPDDGLEYFKALLDCPVDLIQLRAKNLSVADFSELASHAISLRSIKSPNTKIIINDYPAICISSQADGVHLGQHDSDVKSARKELGPDKLIGLSTHNLEQVAQANQENEQQKCLDYLGFGPVYDSPTKSGHAPTVGLENLSNAVKISTLPIVAIGGITLENSKDTFQTGVTTIAIISDLERAATKGLEALAAKIKSF